MPNQKYPPIEKCREMLPEPGAARSPVISYFHGIFIRMYHDDVRPCFHAEFGASAAEFDLSGNLLAGEFPEKPRMYVAVWADIHHVELNVLWKLMQTEAAHFKIRGLN